MRKPSLGMVLVIGAGLVVVIALAATGRIRVGSLPFLLLLACPLMHLFMGHGHGRAGHSGQAGHSGHQGTGGGGQSCHEGPAETAKTRPAEKA